MALSETFLKRTHDPASKEAAHGHATLILEKLDALAALTRDKSGYVFKYNVDYRESEGRVAELAIEGGYFDSSGYPKRYRNYRTATGDYQPLTAKFRISIIPTFGDAAGKQAAGFLGTDWDYDTGTGWPRVTPTDTAPQLIDKFLNKWVSGNIPDASRRLEAYKQETATATGRALQKLQKFAFG